MENKEEKRSGAVVEIIKTGPLKISGNFILKDLKRDNESSPGEVWLCRCGNSNNKPYCDCSHKES
jgi:CDGSH-type Zn-finger protein